jgi:diguanylate cyclase (GGDEF)-like protein
MGRTITHISHDAHGGMAQRATINATGGDACSWIDALPHAAAIVREDADGSSSIPQLVGHNRTFASMFGATLDQLDSRINDACATVLAGEIPVVTIVWDQGGFTGRMFEVTVARFDAADHDTSLALLSFVDRTSQARSEATLRRELASDSLTGLPNRNGLCDQIETRLAEPLLPGQAVTLLLVDMLRFSRINESIGALAGDELLLTVARRLNQMLRNGDVLARTGSDEFAILATTASDSEGATEIAERVRGVFDQPFRIGSMLVSVDCAVGGIAALTRPTPPAEPDPREILRVAQIALKQAKQNDSIAFYEPKVMSHLRARFDRETALRSAIENDAITLAFQPLVDMTTRRIVGFEALARWTHEGEAISPAEFVPIAEDCGLIVPLGRQVIDKVTATLRSWDNAVGSVMPVHIAINVSPLQLARDDIVGAVASSMAKSGILGDRLMVEITESCVVGNPDAAGAILDGLHALGVRIAMDDFGTGYSNIASLRRLPIDTLKIDRSLIAGIDSNTDTLAIVRTIQRLAEALDMHTTAEGIETETVAQRVAAIGCNNGQGYLFSHPLTSEDAFAAWEAAQRR